MFEIIVLVLCAEVLNNANAYMYYVFESGMESVRKEGCRKRWVRKNFIEQNSFVRISNSHLKVNLKIF